MKYKIINAHKTFCSPDWKWENDGLLLKNSFVLWLVMSGYGQVTGDFGRLTLKPGMCLLWRGCEKHIATHDPKNPLIVPWVTFSYLNKDRRTFYPKNIPSRVRIIKNFDFLSELMQRSIEGHMTGRDKEASYWLGAALHEIINHDLSSQGSRNISWQYETIELVSRQITENPFTRFTLDHLAQDADMSVDHLIRIFKKAKGITPGEFILRHRIQTACDLLKYSSHTITEISEMLDYPSIYAFSKQFSQRTGTSPTNFKRKLPNMHPD